MSSVFSSSVLCSLFSSLVVCLNSGYCCAKAEEGLDTLLRNNPPLLILTAFLDFFCRMPPVVMGRINGSKLPMGCGIPAGLNKFEVPRRCRIRVTLRGTFFESDLGGLFDRVRWLGGDFERRCLLRFGDWVLTVDVPP